MENSRLGFVPEPVGCGPKLSDRKCLHLCIENFAFVTHLTILSLKKYLLPTEVIFLGHMRKICQISIYLMD